MVERLQPGRFHGRVIKSLEVAGFILTETAHEARSVLPRHAHENSHFCLVLQGTYTENYGKREIACKPSTLTFCRSGEVHEARLHDTNARVFVVEISPQWIERLRADSLTLRSAFEFSGSGLPQLSVRLNREFHKTDSAAPLAIEGLALELMAQAARQRVAKIRSAPAWLRQAHEMIVDSFPETLPLSQIAGAVGVHPVYLATTFRQRFGVTIGEFVRKLRIEQACAELRKGEVSLTEVALQAGFVDQSHFTKVFKSYLGTTPAQYRRTIHGS